MKTMIVEYFFTTSDTDTFCVDDNAFLALLQLDSSLKLEGDTLCHRGQFSCKCIPKLGKIEEQSRRYFHLRFVAEIEETKQDEQTELFEDMLRGVRQTLTHLGVKRDKEPKGKEHGEEPEGKERGEKLVIIRDDIRLYYSLKAYPLIQEIENLMRQLIGSFMWINVGTEWATGAAHQEFSEAVKRNPRLEMNNPLYSVDFKDLSNLLTKSYSLKSTEQLLQLIEKTTDQAINVNKFEDFIPKSNWKRYFSKLIKCEDEQLRKWWGDIYDLRCLVAHNVGLTKDDFKRLLQLLEKIKPYIERALQKLSEVSVPQEERDAVRKNATTEINDHYGAYLKAWRQVEHQLRSLMLDLGYENKSLFQSFSLLKNAGVLTAEEHILLTTERAFRNQLYHDALFQPENNELSIHLGLLMKISERLAETFSSETGKDLETTIL